MFIFGLWLLKPVVIHTYNVLSLNDEMIPVEAHVVDSVIIKEETSGKNKDSHPWKISYNLEYYFNGSKLFYRGSGNGPFFHYLDHWSRQDAERFLAKRVTNSVIVGHVHPRNPEEFYVNKPKFNLSYFMGLFLSLVGTLGPIYFFVRWLKALAYVR